MSMPDFTAWVEKNRGLWSRVYDEVIAPDFEKEWKKRQEEYQDELKQRDENQQLLFNHINEQIVKNARVVEENERLETELQQRAESAAPSTILDDANTASTGVPEGQHRNLAEKYDELSRRYQDLSQKVKYLERKNTAVMQKNRDMKESVRAWQQYADRMKPHQRPKAVTTATDETPSRLLAVPHSDEVPPYMPSSPGSLSAARDPFQRANQGRSSPAPADTPASGAEEVFREDEDLSLSASVTPRGPSATNAHTHEHQGAAPDLPSLNTRLDEARQYGVVANAVPTSSQTTVDEVADQTTRRTQVCDDEDEDDFPQVVSERSLKRKRGQHSKMDVYTGRFSDGTPAKPHRVKEEPLSSPPPLAHILTRTETIDLDEAVPQGADVASALPRKPSFHFNTTGTIRHQRSGSAPFTQTAIREDAERELISRDRTSNVHAKLQTAADEMRALSEPTEPHLQEQHILQPIDPNIVVKTPERSSNKRMKQAANRHLEHSILAESGEVPPPVDEEGLRLPPSAARARLQRMRVEKEPKTPKSYVQRTPTTGSPLVKQEPMQPPSTTASRVARTHPSPIPRTPLGQGPSNQQDEIVTDGRPVWSLRAPDARPVPQRRNSSPLEAQCRLRDKSLQELKTSDFKPNPVYNNGYTYAFSEAVRKRGDRLCLPGCTNEQCCGSHFRRLAEALAPLSSAEEEALLEDYLGDAYNTVMSTQISSDERTELIMQARTKKIAKDSGKHREAYERRRTPPGFWRVDFPSTQSQEVDRGRAKELEMKAVQERWLEAHKKVGRWIFRDE